MLDVTTLFDDSFFPFKNIYIPVKKTALPNPICHTTLSLSLYTYITCLDIGVNILQTVTSVRSMEKL